MTRAEDRMTPLVSVVVVNWNTHELVLRCLSSVLRETSDLEARGVEVIVVDNASTDDSVAAIRKELGTRVTLIENSWNEGFARACNTGLRRARGRFVLFLNPDSELLAESPTILLGYMESDPDVGITGPRLVGPDGQTQESCSPLPTLGREAWRLLHLDLVWKKSVYPVAAWGHREPRQVEAVQGACMLVRRDLLDQIGAFDEGFFVYSEEIDLCRRAVDAGWRIVWVPEARVLHLGGQSTRLVARRMFIELYRNKLLYFRKHYGFGGALVYKIVLLLASLLRLLVPPLIMPWSRRRRKELVQIVFNYSALVRQLPNL